MAIAFVGIIEALSIAKAIAYQTQQKIDYNRQIMAEGLANLAGGFFQSLPGSGSLSRSAINFQSGAKTRFSGIVSAATVAAALLLFAPLLRYVPQAALAGLLLVTAARLVDFKRLFYTLKASRYDAGLVIITAFTGVAIDLDKSVLLGVILSIVLFVPRAAKLKAKELIVTPERVVRERISGDSADPSIVIYDLEGELFFGAAPELDRYLSELSKRIADDDIKFLVLRLKRVRHPDVVCIERIEHFLREETERGVDRPARRGAPRHAACVEQRRIPKLVRRRARLPRRRRGILGDAQGGALCAQQAGRAEAEAAVHVGTRNRARTPDLYYLV